jgi:hypothetical protein
LLRHSHLGTLPVTSLGSPFGCMSVRKALQKACCAESNTNDHDDEGQTRSGGFDPNYFAHSKKCDEAQNKPIEGRWRGLLRNSSPCSRHSKCSAIFLRLRLFQKLWQLRNIYCDSPRLVTRQQLGGRAPGRLILEINISELLSVLVADNKAGVLRVESRKLCAHAK